MNELDAIAILCRLSNRYGMDSLLVQGAGGNTSVKMSDGKMLVKASGFSLKDVMTRSGWVTLPFESVSSLLNDGNVGNGLDPKLDDSLVTAIDGMTTAPITGHKASIEAAMHAVLDTVVVHIHPVEINAVLCAERAEDLCGDIFKGVPFVWIDPLPPGYHLAKAIYEKLRASGSSKPSVIFMASHGVIVHAETEVEVNRLYDIILSLARSWIAKHASVSATFSTDGWQSEIIERDIFPDTVVFHELAQNLDAVSSSKKQGIIETFAASKIIRDLHTKIGLKSAYLPSEICAYILGMSREKHRQKEATK